MPAPERVQGDAEEVAGGIGDARFIPAFPEFQERVLHQLLGVLAVPGHEVESLEETDVLLLEERVEAGPRFDTFRGEPHHLTLCSHEP